MKREGLYRKRVLVVLVIVLVTVAFIVALTPHASVSQGTCAACHQDKVDSLDASLHSSLNCEACHEGAAVHAIDTSMKPQVRFDLTLCGGCHPDQYASYIKDEPMKTPYGGGVDPPTLWPKTKDFPYYNTIIDGYGFVRDYNEERAHKLMLADHKDILRFKYETCMQCKATKLAYYWDSGKARTIGNTIPVTSGHFDAGEFITIPAGTTVSMATDRVTPYGPTGQPNHEVKVLVTLPGGTKYASYAYPGAITGVDPDPAIARKARKWTWAALYALFIDGLAPENPTVDAGVACNHCHNPHTTQFRLIRKSLLYAISKKGINPYASEPKVYSFEKAAYQDKVNTLCAQCHVEYVCGNSAVDKIDRDFFPWAKVKDLENIYTSLFAYNQDWTHGVGVRPWQSDDPALAGYYPAGALYPITEKLIKSQHPEMETYWRSEHYDHRGTNCKDCHMPQAVNSVGRSYTSHWFTSPVKLLKMGVNPCAKCHSGESAYKKLQQIDERQDNIFALQNRVQLALVDSLKAINAAKAAGRSVPTAVSYHRKAHVRWENLIVSENSMGFHNWGEVEDELKVALDYARKAKYYAQ